MPVNGVPASRLGLALTAAPLGIWQTFDLQLQPGDTLLDPSINLTDMTGGFRRWSSPGVDTELLPGRLHHDSSGLVTQSYMAKFSTLTSPLISTYGHIFHHVTNTARQGRTHIRIRYRTSRPISSSALSLSVDLILKLCMGRVRDLWSCGSCTRPVIGPGTR